MHTLQQLRSGALAGVRRLQLACGLTEFPREIFALADTLEVLDLSSNALSALPDDLPRLHKLRIIFCSDNRFTVLPEALGACAGLRMIGFKANRIATVPAAALPPTLRWLVLTDNAIEELPATIGLCVGLQKLMLAGNRLRALPPELARCTNLELLRIAANHLTELPSWLLQLPRLTWLAYAGNPCAREPSATRAVARAPAGTIAWPLLELGRQLGEGASGVIYQAVYRHDGLMENVAVKLFKGALTSDGLPEWEMAACLGAGAHPHLIPVLGQVSGHPNGARGLVMALIDPALLNLAGPPSLDSCTRDVYAAERRFSLAAVLALAQGIASAVRQLHERGILHGDLYAHNILHDDHGHAVLGDFGAASFFAPDGEQAAALQRLEVRAFGCLLEELIARCDASAQDGPVLAALARLQAACVAPAAATRPAFAEIERQLPGRSPYVR